MTRRRLLGLVVLLIVVGAGAVRYERAKAKEQREATYQSRLRAYSEGFILGMTRNDVEAALQRDRQPFQQMCCMDGLRQSRAYDDLIHIGEESAPWFCSQNNVYIGFEFSSTDSHGAFEARDSDRLTNLKVFHRLEGCL